MALLTHRRMALVIGIFMLATLVVLVAAPMFGPVRINPFVALRDWWRLEPGDTPPPAVLILFGLRLPRVAMALLAGAGLAMVGAVFQALLRNPLATPYTLGISGGGAFGAVLGTMLPGVLPAVAFSLGPFSHVQVFAFAGAMLAVGLIYLLARAGGRVSTLELLLAGVTMGLIFSALIMIVRYFSKPELLVEMDRWMMGGIAVRGWEEPLAALGLLVPSLGALLLMARGLDQLSFGEELAAGRGVNVARLQVVCFFFGSLAVAGVVSATGPIGFVGLIIPHTVRRMIGPDHRLLLPCSALAGGAFLVACDTLARTILAPTELPVGIITALLGGPFFIYLLIRGRRGGRFWAED